MALVPIDVVNPKQVRQRITYHLHFLKGELASLDEDLDEEVRSSPFWREKEDLLRSVPGVGPVVARTLLAELPESGRWTASASQRWSA